MGDPAKDSYSNLLDRYRARRDDYLLRLTSDEETFASDPEKFGTAGRRGFYKGKGPRPTCSLADQDAAAVASDDNHHLAVWTDTACLRAGGPESWDLEDVQAVIARLWQYPDPDAFRKSLVIPDPPNEHGRAPGLRGLLRLLRQLTILGRADLRWRIRTLLRQAGDPLTLAPDYQPGPTFPYDLVERVVESLNQDQDPEPGDQTRLEPLTWQLTSRRVDGTDAPISFADASMVTKGMYALLPGPLAAEVIQAAIVNGRPGPYNVTTRPGWEAPPDSWEPPPYTGHENPGTFGAPENPGTWGPRKDSGTPGSGETPPNTYEDPNPAPAKPRGTDILFLSVWQALETFAFLGRVGTDPTFNVRRAVLTVTAWWRNGTISGDPPADQGRESLITELFQDQVWVPPHSDRAGYHDFAWPPYTAEGMYWWRTTIKPACIEHCYALKDTADFKSTDLIRLVSLFPATDPRIPDYVRTNVTLALLWFKYWWDEPPAKDAKNSDTEEMTMWSENHQILFAESQLLAGAMFRQIEFSRSDFVDSGKPRKGSDHLKEGLTRAERWLDYRLKFGFSEWNAPGYYNEDLPALFNLADFCNPNDPNAADDGERAWLGRIQVKAAMVLDVMIFDLARFTCRGSFGATAGRAYWEHKCYGWEQSVGNMIEVLFGTRGDYTGAEPAGVSLATSKYDVPEALLAIGLDRVLQDQSQPFTDRTRVSIDFGNAADYNIGFDSEQDVCFWWGLEAYYTDNTLEPTKRVVAAHDNLRLCGPFAPLYAIADSGWMAQALIALLGMAVDALQTEAAVLVATQVPFPLNVVIVVVDRDNIIDGIADFFKEFWEYLKLIARSGPWEGAAEGALGGAAVAGVPGAVVGGVGGFFVGLFGSEDDTPHIPDAALQALLEKLLVSFNTGTVLSTANIVTYNNGDAMLSSVQNHLPGQVSFQKQPWMANLGCEACVWTQARFMAPDLGSYLSAWGQFFQDLGLLDFHSAIADVLKTPILQGKGKGSDLFGHDGPNYWTGSLALPMIVQHENAAIIAYDLPAAQRSVSGFSTHAWFPQAMFDETHKQDANDGTWFFGRKDHMQDGVQVGSGYVALFSATKGDWTQEDGNAWNGKEIKPEPPGANVLKGSNIWVCVVSNQVQYKDAGEGKEYDTFCQEVANAYLHISGVGSANGLECSFDVPRAQSPAGKSPRLELFYSDKKGKFAGDDLELENFPRFENRYVSQIVSTAPGGDGLRPQVEGFSKTQSIGFGSSGYGLQHPVTGLTLEHDTVKPERRHDSQKDLVAAAAAGAAANRLRDGLTASRRLPQPAARTRPFARPKLDLSAIRRRTP